MTTKSTKSKPTYDVPAYGYYPANQPLYIYLKGADTYEKVRLGQEVTVIQPDGTTRDGVVSALSVLPLIEAVSSTGASSFQTYGRGYSPLSIIQQLTDAAPEDVIDVTKLYTTVGISLTEAVPAV